MTTTTTAPTTRRALLAIFREHAEELGLCKEQIAALDKWAVALAPKAASPKVNKERMVLAERVLEAMKANPDAEEISAKWITDHVSGVMTTQKATSAVGFLIERGVVERYIGKGKRSYYRIKSS